MTDPGIWISCQRWRSSHPTDGQSVLPLRSGQRRRTEHLSASRPTPYRGLGRAPSGGRFGTHNPGSRQSSARRCRSAPGRAGRVRRYRAIPVRFRQESRRREHRPVSMHTNYGRSPSTKAPLFHLLFFLPGNVGCQMMPPARDVEHQRHDQRHNHPKNDRDVNPTSERRRVG